MATWICTTSISVTLSGGNIFFEILTEECIGEYKHPQIGAVQPELQYF